METNARLCDLSEVGLAGDQMDMTDKTSRLIASWAGCGQACSHHEKV